jgi:hypothetical protein
MNYFCKNGGNMNNKLDMQEEFSYIQINNNIKFDSIIEKL